MADLSTKSVCSIGGCDTPAHCRGWCSKHYSRFKAHGDPLTVKVARHLDAACTVDGCESPRRKREWCETHYSRWRRRGSVADEHQAWVWDDFDACVVCNDAIPEGNGFRRYCGRSCAVMSIRGDRQLAKECVQCSAPIDLNVRSETGRKKYSNATVCTNCRAPHLQRHVPDLFVRDGNSCGICHEQVDYKLKYPDPQSPSVDHVMPRSRGGPDDMANYQLAHLICNIRKQDKVGYTLPKQKQI